MDCQPLIFSDIRLLLHVHPPSEIKIATSEDATSILNFQRDDLPQFMECGGTFGKLFPGVITADDDSKATKLLPELRTKLSELADLRNPLSPVLDFYPRYCRAMAVAPLAIYHFCIAGPPVF